MTRILCACAAWWCASQLIACVQAVPRETFEVHNLSAKCAIVQFSFCRPLYPERSEGVPTTQGSLNE